MAITLLLALVLPMQTPTHVGQVERLDPAIKGGDATAGCNC